MPIYWSLLLALVLGIQTYTLKGQPKAYIDSLELAYSKETVPFEKAQCAYKLAYAHLYSNPKKGLEYIKIAINVIPEDSLISVADNYNLMANIYAQVFPDSLNMAIHYFNKAIHIYQQIDNKDRHALVQFRIGNSYINLGNCYLFLKDYEQSLIQIYKALEIYEANDNKEHIGAVWGILLSINLAQGDLDNALVHAKKALALTPAPKENFAVGDNESSPLINANFNVGLVYMKLNQADSALHYLNIALDISKKIENKNHMAMIYSNIASVYRKQKKLEIAIDYLNKAIQLEKHLVSIKRRLNIRNTLATIYHESGKYDKSISTYQKMLEGALKTNHTDLRISGHRGLAANYAKIKDFEKAYSHLLIATPLKDSLIVENRQEEIEGLEIKYQTRYDTQKKEQQNKLLTKDLAIQKLTSTRNKQQFYGLLVLFLLGAIISYLALRQYRARSIQQMLQLKHRLLRNQMNPHFIFNALVAIQNFVYKNDPRKAGKYLSSFAKLVRAILENSRSEYITLSKEIQWLENYLNLQSLRFNNKFDFDLQIDEQLNLESVLIPPMLTQPFIENALEHGIKSINYHGNLVIKFTLKDSLLMVTVQDNGIGLSATDKIPEKEKHISLATTITRERLDFLNKKSKKKIHLEMTPIQPSGTLVSFSIPLNYIY